MNSGRKVPPPLHGPARHIAQPHKPCVLQPKAAARESQVRTPQAPPVYRPQPVPKVLQRKAAVQPQRPPTAQPNHTPMAPPVYRPQSAPKVLQAKSAVPHNPFNPTTQGSSAQPTSHGLKRPPQPVRPQSAHHQPQRPPAAAPPRPGAPSVVQRMQDKNNPPPTQRTFNLPPIGLNINNPPPVNPIRYPPIVSNQFSYPNTTTSTTPIHPFYFSGMTGNNTNSGMYPPNNANSGMTLPNVMNVGSLLPDFMNIGTTLSNSTGVPLQQYFYTPPQQNVVTQTQRQQTPDKRGVKRKDSSQSDKQKNKAEKRRVKPKKQLLKGINDIDELFRAEMTNIPSGNQQGMAREDDMHVTRPPRARNDDQTLQFLTQLSFVIYTVVKDMYKEEQEVQCMYLNDKLVVTANEPTSISKLTEIFQKCQSESFIETLVDRLDLVLAQRADKTVPKEERKRNELPPRMLERKTNKMYYALEEGSNRSGRIPRELANIVKGAFNSTVIVVNGVDDCLVKLQQGGRKILLLNPGLYHAEQNFALVLAKYTVAVGPAQIVGKKRPCATCLLTLKLLERFWPNVTLSYIPRGGHYFTTANNGLYALVQLGLDQKKFTHEEVNGWLATEIKGQWTHTSKRKEYKKTSSKKDKKESRGDTAINSESESEDDELSKRWRRDRKKRKEQKATQSTEGL